MLQTTLSPAAEAVREQIVIAPHHPDRLRRPPPRPGAIEDDHVPFLRRGVNALDLIDYDYGPNNAYWHNDKDTLDKLSAQSFQIVGRVLMEVLKELAGGSDGRDHRR